MIRKKKRIKDTDFELDLTPAISVALILVLIFITGATQIFQTWLTVTSPRVRKAPQVIEKEQKTEFKVNIHLLSSGQILLNEEVITQKKLDSLLPELMIRSATGLVLVSADSEVEHGKVVEIIDLAKQKGAREVALLKRVK
ncbi:MAG: biopolymer transporter ExbD [Candidatus Hydrothermales bacterium]